MPDRSKKSLDAAKISSPHSRRFLAARVGACPRFAHTSRREVMYMASKGRARSAITGRFVKKSTAARNPRTTVVEKPKKR